MILICRIVHFMSHAEFSMGDVITVTHEDVPFFNNLNNNLLLVNTYSINQIFQTTIKSIIKWVFIQNSDMCIHLPIFRMDIGYVWLGISQVYFTLISIFSQSHKWIKTSIASNKFNWNWNLYFDSQTGLTYSCCPQMIMQ